MIVLVNHINKSLLPSGFLGVDIFFVISGYVITSSILSKNIRNFWKFLAGFYEKRLKRLLPALIVFVLTTSFFLCFFDSDPIFSLRTGFAALFGISNIYLLEQSTDYFAESANLNFFTHTWSLGIEQQFYFIFPFIIWLTRINSYKINKEKLIYLISLLSLFSLILFIFFYPINQPLAYFSLLTRFWEIGLGSLTFLSKDNIFKYSKLIKKLPISIIALLLLFTLFLPVNYAVTAIILASLLTSLLILKSSENSIFKRSMTKKPILYIGKISYSIYLFHWPILVLSRFTIGIHWWSIPFQIMVIFLVSHLSYYFIESKFNIISIDTFKIFLYSLLSLFFSGTYIFSLIKFNNLFYLGSKEIKKELKRNHLGDSSNRHCDFAYKREEISNKVIMECTFKNKIKNDVEQTNLYFVGSSHSGTLSGLIEFLINNANFRIINTYVGATLFPSINEKFYPRIFNDSRPKTEIHNKKQKLIESFLLKIVGKGDSILIANHLAVIFSKHNQNNIFPSKKGDLLLNKYFDNLNLFTKKLNAKGVKVVYLSPYPFFSIPKESAFKNTKYCDEWFSKINFNKNKNCFLKRSRKELIQNQEKIYYFLKKLQNKNSNFFLVDIFEKFCPENKSNICQNTINKKIYLYDESHLNYYGGKYVGPYVLKELEVILSKISKE